MGTILNGVDSFTFACSAGWILLTKQQWIFTCLLTHLIGFTQCRDARASSKFPFNNKHILNTCYFMRIF